MIETKEKNRYTNINIILSFLRSLHLVRIKMSLIDTLNEPLPPLPLNKHKQNETVYSAEYIYIFSL